ncbi:hypothetical protein [Spiroplasma endosymbiont of Polydrusus pterygomalis]|uniref:hypothetical protein n=1 Tax=Spiroplasma endosymbiont of Polydrusus pterygomalis TaxID=3139327 RepID=UPI003CCAB2B8
MNTCLININEFIEKISPKDDFKGIDLLEEYYFFEKQANIKIYVELIQKMNNESFKKIEITKEEKQKYEECLSYFTNEIKKAKESYQKKYVDKNEKHEKLLEKNDQDINNSLRINSNYSKNIKKLEIKKISKWKNTFLKIISLNFFDWNKKIIIQQQRLKHNKLDNDNWIKELNAEKQKYKKIKENIDFQFQKDLLKISNVIADFDLLKAEVNDLVSVKSIEDEIECEIAEEAFAKEMFVPLSKPRNSFCSQDSGFESKSNSDSEEWSYSNNYDYSNFQPAINIKKSDSLKI